MSILKKIQALGDVPGTYNEKLYLVLTMPPYTGSNYQRRNLDENMEVVEFLVGQYWKPRFLLNHTDKTAYECMDADCRLLHVSDDDIKWDTLKNLPEALLERVRDRNASYPSFFYRFEGGVSEVRWQLNPDGRYWMDDDGYGMTDDQEVNIYGVMDTECKMVIPFQMIDDFKKLTALEAKAKKIVAARKKSAE